MKTTELSEILETVEALRAEMHPQLDRKLLEAIVYAEEANPEDDGQAIAEIRARLESLLTELERS